MIKYGDFTDKSKGDFDPKAKAMYGDSESTAVADEANKHKLIKPVKLPETQVKPN